jgi:prevent-host-death family protein
MKSKTVGIRVLKNRLSAYVRAIAEDGEEVSITDRGREVARLVRPDTRAAARPGPLQVRHAVKDHSDLAWMKPRRGRGDLPVRAADLASVLDFARDDKKPL